jgi:Protein of unknown function (DUF3106)
VIQGLARIAAAVAAAAVAALALAAPPAEQPPTWASLTRSQRETLAPLQHDWATIDPIRKQKWLEVAGRFPHMPAAERQRVQARMAEWARMTPAQREQARLRYQQSRRLSASERQAKWKAYQALPEEQRRILAQRARPPARPASASAAAAKGHPGNRNGTAHDSRPASPIVVQADPGATTTTLTTRPPHPQRHRPAHAKIAATPGQVDPATLLPRHGAARTADRPPSAPGGASRK